ncbi:hypothetical protein H5410_059944 [Solanum commersonii]|uniref:Uncharacterized protein n=1 Tax=Solanum commersonii TaxID=4109 RepID=A0A9J5W3W4_SOLCO|nr:hypothetical protein H5410_059944 [Solanum commersonii]
MCPSPFQDFATLNRGSTTFLFLSVQRGSHPWRQLTGIPTTPASLRSSSKTPLKQPRAYYTVINMFGSGGSSLSQRKEAFSIDCMLHFASSLRKE